jgi:hypothetical protein
MVKLDADPEVAFGKFWIYDGVANLRGVRSAVEGGPSRVTPDRPRARTVSGNLL